MRSLSQRLTSVGLMSVLIFALAFAAMPASAQTVENDIAYEVLSTATDEPLALEIAPDGRIIWAERHGLVHVLTPQGVQINAGALLPACNLGPACQPEPDYLSRPPNRLGVGGLEEGGLHGLLLHRNFAQNNKILTYRSIPGTRHEVKPGLFEGEFRLSSFVLDPVTNRIDTNSEQVLLKVPAEWDHCCHYGGDLDYLPDGTITLTTGDDIDASASGGYGPRDHRNFWTNGEGTSANPADRRGKVLRLREDGTVPDGSRPGETPNPFIGQEGYNPYIADSSGTPNDGWIEFDPYVYAMGFKQPWRAVVHPNGTMYVSDVGPDAGTTDPQRGPAGLEEMNQIPFGGGTHYGWPRCAGPNIPYMDVNWATLAVGGPLDCSANAPVSRPTGDTDPTHVKRGMTGSVMWYPSAASPEWPIVNGTGGKTSEPVAFYPAETKGRLRLPARYNNRMMLLEWSRDFILSIGYDPATAELNLNNSDMWRVTAPQTYVSPDADNPVGTVSAQQTKLMHPVDAKVGPDGALYFLEYGAFFYAGANGRLSRIRCATCAPADPTKNYGLPVAKTGATTVKPLAAGLGADLRTFAVIGVVVGLTTLLVRRRRRVIA